MNKDYLWDGSGKPDPEIENLEKTLGRFRHNRTAPEFPEIISGREPKRFRFSWPSSSFPRFGFAAGAVVLLAVSIWFSHRRMYGTAREETFTVTGLQGSPKIGRKSFANFGHLSVGQSLTTDQNSRARIHVNNFGDVTVESNSRVRLVEAHSNRKQLALDRGALNARITAPPWQFYVETPSATAVDLGCEYRLTVDESGEGLIRVTLGWVQFYMGQRQILIPAGAAAKTRPGLGPGTPYFEDVSPSFQKALDQLDLGNGNGEVRAAALDLILREAKRQDALTLFPLLDNLTESERGHVYDRLAKLNPPPAGVTREGVMHYDKRQTNLWWDNWGLGRPGN